MAHFLADDSKASALRSVLRAAVICVTAFGLNLDATQVAAVQVFVESLIQFGRTFAKR